MVMKPSQFVNKTYAEMQECLRQSYQKSQSLTPHERYRLITRVFRSIINQSETLYYAKAQEYFKKRQESDAKLTGIQTLALDQMESCFRQSKCVKKFRIDLRVIPASSFSAGTHLVGESDIDFIILVDKLDRQKAICVANALGRCSFSYQEARNITQESLLHWVFEKYIDGVEIEGKVRDYDGFREMLKMHAFLDTQMSEKVRILVTYLKHLYKTHNREAYDLFKMFYYCYGGYYGGTKALLYPLL